MQSWSSKDFTADRAWGALDIANFSGTTVRLHWTDQPYIWHINDGQEVFAVMDGQVAMHVKVDGEEQVIMLNAGDIFYAGVGCEHVAHPQGAARILVIENLLPQAPDQAQSRERSWQPCSGTTQYSL